MDVVVDVLACNRGVGRRGMLRLSDGPLVLELCLLGLKALTDVVVIAVLDVAVLDAGEVVRVLFWKNLTVLDWLHGGVVVVLVDFAIDGCLSIFVLGAGYVFVLDGGVDSLLELVEMWKREGELCTSWTVVSCFPSLERKLETAAFALSILCDV